MKKLKLLLTKILVISLACMMLVPQFAAAASSKSRIIRIADMEGTVKVLIAGGEKEYKAFKGMNLNAGDRITTAADSWARLEIDDDKEVKIGENTQITMSEVSGQIEEENQRTGVSLWAGKLWVNIKKKLNMRQKFEIKTPTTVMGVKGTQFFVGAGDGRTDIAVLNGIVYASAPIPPSEIESDMPPSWMDVDITEGHQITFDLTSQSPEAPEIQPITQDSLDLMVLEEIRQAPEGISPELLQDIDRVIEQRQQEQEQQRQQSQNQQPTPAPTARINYAPEVAAPAPATPTPVTPPPPPSPSPTPEITISPIADVNMEARATTYITVGTNPTAAYIDNVASSDTGIATVSADGKLLIIKAVNPGTATISFSTHLDGYLSKELSFKVNASEDSTPPYVIKPYIGASILSGEGISIIFSEPLSTESKTSVETAIKNGIVCYATGMNFGWSDDARILSVTNNTDDDVYLYGNTYALLIDLSGNQSIGRIIGTSSEITAISAGNNHTLALTEDDYVWAWGNNDNGKLGTNDENDRYIPIRISEFDNIEKIEAGGGHSLALDANGNVWGWGNNLSGQLGQGTNDPNNQYDYPVQVISSNNITDIAADNGLGATYTVTPGGTLLVCGSNETGRLGLGNAGNQTSPAAMVISTDISSITAIDAGTDHVAALDSFGRVWTWGRNDHGQLGDGTTITRAIPVQVSALSNTSISTISAGGSHTVALDSNGKVWTWGNNSEGQLGDGTYIDSHIPKMVNLPENVFITAISAGGNFTLALDSEGNVWSWGENKRGQLANGNYGNGIGTGRTTPDKIADFSDVKAISAGSEYAVALKNDGTIWSWGDNTSGQLGIGTTIVDHMNNPVMVIMMSEYIYPN